MKSNAAGRKKPARSYPRFERVNGEHDFRAAVPQGFVDYEAKRRHGGKVAFFNFDLAKDMGLLPPEHEHKLNPALEKKILETFAIQIINEWDIEHKVKIPAQDRLPHKYMATRYLQLQHPDKRGTTSGDGRSIWNGQISHRGVTWDISSCGTGATRLSPATATEGKFFRTGDPEVCYGCGYADLSDGISAAIMSEILHKNGLKTERTLAVIEFSGDFSINVRAGQNLLRPSHFFHHLKQGNRNDLRAAIEYFYDRQVRNQGWPRFRSASKRYRFLTQQIAKDFAHATADFETDYIFCWLDWDGDNILSDGGIIDYGSIRQFGLYHHEYRYDDGEDRWSTTIKEQKVKARYIVQTFAQVEDFLIRGRKKNIKQFARCKALDLFEKEFDLQVLKNTLYRIGFNKEQREFLFKRHLNKVRRFRRIYQYFERAKSSRGMYNTVDGITWDAIFCMRDILRELPVFLMNHQRWMEDHEFMEVIASSYANRRDREVTPTKRRKIREFQAAYEALCNEVIPAKARRSGKGVDARRGASIHDRKRHRVLLEITMRSSVINQYDRITGNSVIHVTEQILRDRKRLSYNETQAIVEHFIEYQKLRPGQSNEIDQSNLIEHQRAERVVNRILKLVRDYRESL